MYISILSADPFFNVLLNLQKSLLQVALASGLKLCVINLLQVASLQAELAFVQAQLASRVSSGSASISTNHPVMSSSSYSQHLQFPAHLSLPCQPIPQPYNALLSRVKEENSCGFATYMDCDFSVSPSDSSSPLMEVLQRCKSLEENEGEDNGELQALAHALLRRG